MYLVEVASLEDITALESSKDLWNSENVLKKHPFIGTGKPSCLTAGVVSFCTNALWEWSTGKKGHWGGKRGGGDGRGESEVLSAHTDARRNPRVILLRCTTLTEEAPQPPPGRPSDCAWKHLPKAFPWDERHSCLSGCPGASPDIHSPCSGLGFTAPDTLSSCQIRTNKLTAVSNLDFFVYILFTVFRMKF